MKNIVIIAGSVLCLAMSTTIIHARPTKRYDERTMMCRLIAQGQLGWDSEPWGRGGKKFREVCKSCHTRDNNQGAPFLHAQSKMSNGWNRVFAKRRAQCAKDGSWDVLSEEEIQLVNDYLFRNAAWTSDPNSADSCG